MCSVYGKYVYINNLMVWHLLVIQSYTKIYSKNRNVWWFKLFYVRENLFEDDI